MNIPLAVDVNNDGLTIVFNASGVTVPLPFPPFLQLPTEDRTRDTTYRYRIGSDKEVAIQKIEANTVEEYEARYVGGEVNKIRYIEQVYSQLPEYFRQYSNTDPLKIVVLDIEVLTEGTGVFPRASTNPIVAIGIKVVGTDDIYIYSIDRSDLKRSIPDDEIIKSAIDIIKEIDPDIIATYNGIRFDIPYLLERMGIAGIDQRLLSRNNEIPAPDDIPWRIHWDMWRDVEGDQTLLGLPNRRLKTIGHHFGWSDIIDMGKEALSNTSTLVGTSEMDEYLASDLRLTEQLTSVYISNHVALAEMVGIPLREEIASYSSLIPKIYHIRSMKDKYIGLRSNRDRYLDMLGTMRYEAARVAAYKDGVEVDVIGEYFPKVWKIDFSSQYPTAMITFNLSPDTTSIYECREYTGKYQFRNTGNTLWLDIPDKNCGKQIIIKVDLSKDGFLRTLLGQVMGERSNIKKLMGGRQDKELYSRQWALKVLANSIYGYNGLATAKWGDLSVAIATVGICRWLITETERYLERNGIGLIEIDTDGIITMHGPHMDTLNGWLDNLITSTFRVESSMQVELEEYGSGWFYRCKNYIYEDGGTIVRKGAVFKSSRHSSIYSHALDVLSEAVLAQTVELWPIVKELRDWSNYSIQDFIMRTSFRQEPNEYSNQNSIQPKLARQAASKLDIEIHKGDGLDYIVTTGRQYTITSEVNSMDQVDLGYYGDELDKILTIFGLSSIQQLDLF